MAVDWAIQVTTVSRSLPASILRELTRSVFGVDGTVLKDVTDDRLVVTRESVVLVSEHRGRTDFQLGPSDLEHAMRVLAQSNSDPMGDRADIVVQLAAEYKDAISIHLPVTLFRNLSLLGSTLDIDLMNASETSYRDSSYRVLMVRESDMNVGTVASSSWRPTTAAEMRGWGFQEGDEMVAYLAEHMRSFTDATRLVCLITGGRGEPALFFGADSVTLIGALGLSLVVLVVPSFG